MIYNYNLPPDSPLMYTSFFFLIMFFVLLTLSLRQVMKVRKWFADEQNTSLWRSLDKKQRRSFSWLLDDNGKVLFSSSKSSKNFFKKEPTAQNNPVFTRNLLLGLTTFALVMAIIFFAAYVSEFQVV